MAMPWQDVPKYWYRILRLHFSLIFRFGEVHPDLPNGDLLSLVSTQAPQKPMELSLPTAFAEDLNGQFKTLTAQMLKELGEPDFPVILAWSFAVRVFQCLVTFMLGWRCGLSAGLLQFVVAPLSLTGAFIRLLTNVSDCVLHYACSFIAAEALSSIARALPIGLKSPTVTIDVYFLACFFIVDFLLNVLVHMNTSESFGFRRMASHVVYGTFNTKTYFLVVLGALLGFELDLAVVCLGSLLTKAAIKYGVYGWLLRVSKWPCFPICFYIEHRIGHLPVVYQNAHKMHHYLHDSTAFDAHIYGSGMNEEYFWILAETIPCILAPSLFFPYFLNFETLYQSWTNKGAHTRTEEGVGLDNLGCFDEDNYHADHHTLHRANFGSSTGALLDFYFGTEGSSTKGVSGLAYSSRADPGNPGHRIFRIERASGPNRADRMRAPVGEEGQTADKQKHDERILEDSSSNLRIISKQELSTKRSRAEGGVWVALHGAVFDLTTFHLAHPGGPQVILTHAGTDATSTFAEVGHSSNAKAMAAKRLVGLLEGSSPSGFVESLVQSKLPKAKENGLHTPLLASA